MTQETTLKPGNGLVKDGGAVVSTLHAAMEARKAALLECPIRSDHRFSPGKCPKCKATARMPCGINTEQDAIIVDVVREIVRDHQPAKGAS